MISSSARSTAQQVAVGELHALWRAGRARRVDQRQQVVGLHRPPAASMSKSGLERLDLGQRERALGRLAVDDDHVLEVGQLLARLEQRSQERPLDDRHPGAGVRDQVLGSARACRSGRSRTGSHRASWRRGRRGGTRAGCRSSARRCRRARRRARPARLPARPRVAQLAPRDRHLVLAGAHGHALAVVRAVAGTRRASVRVSVGTRRSPPRCARHLSLLRRRNAARDQRTPKPCRAIGRCRWSGRWRTAR